MHKDPSVANKRGPRLPRADTSDTTVEMALILTGFLSMLLERDFSTLATRPRREITDVSGWARFSRGHHWDQHPRDGNPGRVPGTSQLQQLVELDCRAARPRWRRGPLGLQ
jgi:hypothetical protein